MKESEVVEALGELAKEARALLTPGVTSFAAAAGLVNGKAVRITVELIPEWTKKDGAQWVQRASWWVDGTRIVVNAPIDLLDVVCS